MEQGGGQERRRSPRVAVELWVEESHEKALYFERAANLSEGGLFLENTVPHPVGTVVQLKFSLPGDPTPVRVQGKIVSAMGGGTELGMGVQFVDVADDMLERIRAFIEKGISQKHA